MLTLSLGLIDAFRRFGGIWMDAWGMAAEPAPYSWLSTGTGARLRRYANDTADDAPVALLVPAPIKTADIWDLSPRASVVRRFLAAGFRVYLVDWPDVERRGSDCLGLEGYVDNLLGACARAAMKDAGASRLHLAGHSLGGTLTALACCLNPGIYETLTLVGAPLDFRPEAGPLSRWATSAVATATALPTGDPIPGSTLSLAAFAAAPAAFWEERADDLLAVTGDPQLTRLHWQAERWLMAERAVPRQLLLDVLEKLYATNGFMSGKLTLSGRRVGARGLSVPTAVLVNARCAVAPASSVLPALTRPGAPVHRVFWYEEEAGTAIQHVTPLIGPRANASLWPRVLAWLRKPAEIDPLHIPGDRRHTGG